MSKQREISSEEILYALINEAERDSINEIQINKELCKAIGVLNYKINAYFLWKI